jgi:hypothetical protein
MNAWELTYTNTVDGFMFHSGVKFNNRIVLIGGYDDGHALKWIVSSPDGRKITSFDKTPVGFPRRYAHASCVFDEKIFVSGGVDDSMVEHNDIFVTQDAEHFENVGNLNNSIYDHKMVAFGNPRVQLVVLGGLRGMNFRNEIFQSSGGRNWEQVNVQGTHWNPRGGFGALVYKNKLWIFGGVGDGDTDYNDVWWTDDLIHWHRALEHAPWHARSNFGFCEWDERMWVIGGKIFNYRQQDYIYFRDTWFSRDGTTWERAFDFPSDLGYTYAHEIDGYLHVFAGNGNNHHIYKMRLG